MHPGMSVIKASESILPTIEAAVGVTEKDREDADSSEGHLNEFFRVGRHGFTTDVEFDPNGKNGGKGSVSCNFNYEHGGETAVTTTFQKVVGEAGWLCRDIVFGRPSNPATQAWLSIADKLIVEFPGEFHEDNRGIYHIQNDDGAYVIMHRIAELIRLLPANDQVPGTPEPAA